MTYNMFVGTLNLTQSNPLMLLSWLWHAVGLHVIWPLMWRWSELFCVVLCTEVVYSHKQFVQLYGFAFVTLDPFHFV